jgi:hypothetical protein
MAKKKEQTAEVESKPTAVSKGVAKPATKGRKRTSSPKASGDAPSPSSQPGDNHSNGAVPAEEKKHTHHSEPVNLHHGEIHPKVQVTNETISVRAYFLSEARQAMGLPADSHADWLEAERLLKSEG